MPVESIRTRIRKNPFVPFRLHVSDGSRYYVLHHDFALVTARHVTVVIGAPSADDMPESSVEIDPLHITRVESIPPNGRRSRQTKGKRTG